MMLLQISSAQGPAECERAVALALRRLLAEAAAAGVSVDEVERAEGDRRGTLRSVLLTLEGAAAPALAERWRGTVQWICASPYRPRHARKNWFIGVSAHAEPEAETLGEIRYEACRASGPGGQHVNKTDSAVRAVHVATGLSVKVQSERSQHANRKLAALLLAGKLAERARRAEGAARAERRREHHAVERGNAGRVFRGEGFEPAGGEAG